jgi:hypothetical protein
MDSTLLPQNNVSNLALSNNGGLTPTPQHGLSAGANSMIGLGGYGGETNYDFFDPQHWVLDGLLDFTYTSYAQPLEGM